MALPKRSPVLGYNHNVRYRGLVFHVQTEDSGAATPHIFTHLFHAGVIINTRKHVYEAAATEEAVKSAMQTQHKTALKELKSNTFDDKIDQYLAGTPGLLPRGAPDEAGPAATDSAIFAAVDARPDAAATTEVPPTASVPYAAMPRASTAPVVVSRAGTGETLAAAAATAKHAAGRTAVAPPDGPSRSVSGAFRAAADAGASTGYAVHHGRTVTPSAGAGQSGQPGQPGQPGQARPPADPGSKLPSLGARAAVSAGPVTAPAPSPRARRNTDPRASVDTRAVGNRGVIVNAPSQVVGGARPPIPAAPSRLATPGPREQTIVDPPVEQGFAKDIISEKSLDEVILAYLTDEK